jgi:hypothetical protein
MGSSLPQPDRLSRLNAVAKPTMAKAKPSINEVDKAARIVRLAIARSGVLLKTLADDKGRFTRQLDGTGADRLWFHAMVAEWPAEVWRELLPLLALEICGDHFEVERSVTIKEKRG